MGGGAFAGPASTESFKDVYKISKNKTHKFDYSDDEIALHKLYQQVRELRENQQTDVQLLNTMYKEIQQSYKNEWLLLLEMYELLSEDDSVLKTTIYQNLVALKEQEKFSKLITDGLNLISKNTLTV